LIFSINLFKLIRPSYVVKLTIVLIVGHFLIFAKFCEITQKY